jgi:dTDP-4-dehydrorhamnose reductase
VGDYISGKKPDVIIHTAAVTNVSYCEENRKEAYETNVEGTENLIDACLNHNPDCYFVLISTACVFRGDVGNYVETDLPYPKNYYALTKLFTDRYGTYLFASDVASAVKFIVQQKLTGIVHVCGDEKMSMFELAKITTPNIQPMTLSEYHGVPLTVDMSLDSIRIKPFKISR